MSRLRSIWEYCKFRVRYPAVPFVQPHKKVGTFFSQEGQDLYLAALLLPLVEAGRLSRVVVDVGANDPRKFSNSLFFEKYLGCETIAVEPLREFEDRWRAQRAHATFCNVALGSKECELVLNVPSGYDDMFSSLDGSRGKAQVRALPHERRTVRVTTLTALLKARGITEVLLLSMDVEGAELDALQGIDFDELKFAAVLIENNADAYFGDDAIRQYMLKRGYRYHARLGWLDDLFVHPSVVEGAP